MTAVIAPYGCSTPAQRIDASASEWGFQKLVLEGQEFLHVAYYKPGDLDNGELHVYLGGDGTPWIGHVRVAADPTPRNPVALRLMRLDPKPALYLGRPCYHDMADAVPCHPWHWTHGRYSERVVHSMAAALARFIKGRNYADIVLFGYSGGGVLAMLLAERFEQVRAVVTIAANLDIDEWADLHGYSRLRGSLNPAQREPLRDSIIQLHGVGELDLNVPPALVAKAMAHQPWHAVRVVPGFDHRCCWESIWRSWVEKVDAP